MTMTSNGMKRWGCELVFVAYACYGTGNGELERVGVATSYGGAQDLIRRWVRVGDRVKHVSYFRIIMEGGVRVLSGR